MALSDLAVYSEYAYSAFTETLRQQTDLFNAATGNAIMLQSAAHQGDYDETAFWAKIQGGTVRRRNAYGTGAIAQKTINHLKDRSVKVAAGTPEFVYEHSQFTWIQRSPEEAGAVFGQQLAKDSLADMLNTALGATYSALVQVPEVVFDATANTAPADKKATWKNLNKGQSKFGDASTDIGVWVMHSAPLFDIYDSGLTNAERLFTYGTVNVAVDPWGRLIVITDSEQLKQAGTPDKYHIMGLTQGATYIGQNNDFFANEETKNGGENIQVSYQAEWTYNLGIKGFAWDTANGGKSPTNAALFTSTNWDRSATSHKDLAGVIVEVN